MRRLMMQKYGGEPSISFPTIFKVENITVNTKATRYELNPTLSVNTSFIVKLRFCVNSITRGTIVIIDIALQESTDSSYYDKIFTLDFNTSKQLRISIKNKIGNEVVKGEVLYVLNLNTLYDFEFFYDAGNKTSKVSLYDDVNGGRNKVVDVTYNIEYANYDWDYVSLGGRANSAATLNGQIQYDSVEIQQES